MTVPQPPRSGPQPPYHAPPQPQYHNPQQASVHSLANYAPPPLPPAQDAGASRKVFTPFVAAWSVLGITAGCSLGYLVMKGQVPISLDDPRIPSTLTSEISGLKDNISQVRMELAKLQTDIAGQDAHGRMLSAQLTALERKLSGDAGVDAGIQADAESPAPDAAAQKGGAKAVQDGSTAAATPQRPRLVNSDPALQGFDPAALETGSVTAAAKTGAKAAAKKAEKPEAEAAVAGASDAVDFSKVVVTPAAKPIGVQISSGASVDSLRLSWSLLSDRHGEALKDLEPRFIARGDENAPTFDLIAGPIKSRADAQKVCKALAAKNVPCKVGDYLGEAL